MFPFFMKQQDDIVDIFWLDENTYTCYLADHTVNGFSMNSKNCIVGSQSIHLVDKLYATHDGK